MYMFQPIVSATDGSVYGYEALMRPKSQILKSPIEVLELAKVQSKLYHIEQLTFFKCLEEYTEFQDASRYKIFINSISNKILSNEDIRNLEGRFKEHLKNIVVEIPEDENVNENFTETKQKIFKKWGGKLASYDLEQGCKGEEKRLSYLHNYMKIDRSMIMNIDKDNSKQLVLEEIVRIAKKQNVFIVAEGVETRPELEKVILAGVDYIQGYYIGKPDYRLKAMEESKIKEIIEIRQERKKAVFK